MKNIQFLLEVIDNKVIYNVNLIAIFIKRITYGFINKI
jgi:hypothetical protein